MFIKKAVNVVAAASVAVLGVVGVVSAQTPSFTPDDKPANLNPLTTPLSPGPVANTMSVSFEVKLEAEMHVDPAGLSNDKLFDPTPSAPSSAGSLGTVNVKTNYPKWDVWVKADARLKLAGAMDYDTTTGGFPGTPPTITPKPGNFLMAVGDGSAANDTARLQVWAGLLNEDGNDYETGTPQNITAALRSANGASLAYELANAQTLGAFSGTGQDWSDIEDDGFGPPINNTRGVTFYLSAALADGAGNLIPKATGIKGKNKNGQYTETINFELVAGY